MLKKDWVCFLFRFFPSVVFPFTKLASLTEVPLKRQGRATGKIGKNISQHNTTLLGAGERGLL